MAPFSLSIEKPRVASRRNYVPLQRYIASYLPHMAHGRRHLARSRRGDTAGGRAA